MNLQNCRICDNDELYEVLDLGRMPLANGFKEDPTKDQAEYPLRVVWCPECTLMQIDEIVPPDEMFSEYLYVSGTSDRMERHFDQLAVNVVDQFDLTSNSQVLDIGSNDGTLLKQFQKLGYNVVGVEPATNIAEIAKNQGIETVNEFFDEQSAISIREKYGEMDVVTATNVFAHTHDVHSVISGVSKVLSDDGVFVIEVPYLIDLLENTEFDTIYHEHLSYFSVSALEYLFNIHDFDLVDVDRLDIHGGSIRVCATQNSNTNDVSDNISELLAFEDQFGVSSVNVYDEFANAVVDLKNDLMNVLKNLKKNGETIAGYGAAAKGNTLLNYYNIDNETIDFIADKNELKQGLYTPGTGIKVVSPDKIYDEHPDYLLILAWNFSEEIMEQQSEYKDLGGQFIIPVPEVSII